MPRTQRPEPEKAADLAALRFLDQAVDPGQESIRAERLLHERRFRAAYDFLLLKARVEPDLQALVRFWTDIQEMKPDEQRALLQIKKSSNSRGNRNRRKTVRRRK